MKNNFDKENFCLAPWLSLRLINDHYWPCRSIKADFSYANESSLKEAWNSQTAGQFRYNFLANKHNAECSDCFSSEKIRKSERKLLLDYALENGLKSIEQLTFLKTPSFLTLDLNSKFVQANFDNLVEWLPNLQQLTFRTAHIRDNSLFHMILELLNRVKCHPNFNLVIETNDFNFSDDASAILKTLKSVRLVYCFGEDEHSFSNDQLALLNQIASSATHIKISSELSISSLNVFALRSILEQLKQFKITVELFVIPSQDYLSISNLSPVLKSEIAHVIKFINAADYYLKDKAVIREILDWMNITADPQLSKKLMQEFEKQKHKLLECFPQYDLILQKYQEIKC